MSTQQEITAEIEILSLAMSRDVTRKSNPQAAPQFYSLLPRLNLFGGDTRY